MAETGNIEEVAKKVSDDIFKWLKWDRCSPCDLNWSCEILEHRKLTHPSDVVFYYKDPYTGKLTYLNTDLKSYASGSITVSSLTTALSSLAKSVECANISEDWQNKFMLRDVEFGSVKGLLFIYNHDGHFDRDFSELFSKISCEKLPVANLNELAVFGPDTIKRLINIVTDLKILKAEEILPSIDDYTFFYPDLFRSRRCGTEWGHAATIEAITSPWLFIKHKAASDDVKPGFLIYYHDSGDTVEEFVYLLDAMSHYQLFSSEYIINVRLTNPSPIAVVNFDKAKHEYLRVWGDDPGRKKLLESISFGQINRYISKYNPYEIGMRDND